MKISIPHMMRVLAVTILLFTASISLALAADDDGTEKIITETTITIGTGPESATGPTAEWISISAGEKHWYAFTEGGDENDVEVRMAEAPADRLAFEVWTSEQLRAWQNGDEFDPVGAGTTNKNLNDDLYWTGNFLAGNTYYVIVNSRNFGPADYRLTISGDDVGFPIVVQETQTQAPTETIEVIATDERAVEEVVAIETVIEEEVVAEQTVVEEAAAEEVAVEGAAETQEADANEALLAENTNESNTDEEMLGTQPGLALAPVGTMMEITPGETHWYAFRDEGDGEAIQAVLDASPTVGIEFEVWTAEQLRLWQVGEEFDPVGAGTENSGLDIDHYWSGSFTRSGDYYVIVRHSRLIDGVVSYSLSITGSDISF